MLGMKTINTALVICSLVVFYFSYEIRRLHYAFKIPISLILWFLSIYCVHCLAHYIVGTILGIRFKGYKFSKSMLSKAGIPIISKIFSKKVFLTLIIGERRDKKANFYMFISGPIASILFPFVVSLIIYSHSKLLGVFLIVLSSFNAVFTGYFSYRYGCIKKALNSLKNS